MKATGKIWIFYDKTERKQGKPMSSIHAQMEILALRPAEYSDYLIWTPGWSEWIPLEKFLPSGQNVFVMAPQVKAPPQSVPKHSQPKEQAGEFTQIDIKSKPAPKEDYGYYYQEFSAEKIDIDAKPIPKSAEIQTDGAERRIYDRHPMKLEVILLGRNGKAFRSHSVNLSLGGTLLEDEIPKAFFNTQFDLVIVNRFEKNTDLARL